MYTTFVDKRYSNHDTPNKSSNYSKKFGSLLCFNSNLFKAKKGSAEEQTKTLVTRKTRLNISNFKVQFFHSLNRDPFNAFIGNLFKLPLNKKKKKIKKTEKE